MRRSIRFAVSFCMTLMLVGIPFLASPAPVAAQAPPPQIKTYNLFATDGWWTMADGTQIYSYGFVGGDASVPFNFLRRNGTLGYAAPQLPPAPVPGPNTPAEQNLQGCAQFPAPIIYARVGDTVVIRLKNLGVNLRQAPNDPHSVHLHGLDVDAANDGVPETSVAAVAANLGITPTGEPGAGNLVVYQFVASLPGTYMYHCHQEADIHVTMGMYGALVIYNPDDPAGLTGPGQGQGGTLFGGTYTRDVVMLLSDTDIRQHKSEQLAGVPVTFNPVNYTPQYWFINGLSFPQTVHAGFNFPAMPNYTWSNWIAAHPGYDPLITGSVSAQDKVLIRVINLGFETQPMHMHGYHGTVLGSDARPFTWTNLQYEKNTLTVGSGETYEWMIDIAEHQPTSTYNPDTQSRYNPADNSPQLNTATQFPRIDGYRGGPVVSGADLPELDTFPSQIFVFHNHDDYKATNNGAYPGGMFTCIVPLP